MGEGKKAMADVIDMEEWDERAAILEYMGGYSRDEAERLAWEMVRKNAVQSHGDGPGAFSGTQDGMV
jgi:hypothetical protein